MDLHPTSWVTQGTLSCHGWFFIVQPTTVVWKPYMIANSGEDVWQRMRLAFLRRLGVIHWEIKLDATLFTRCNYCLCLFVKCLNQGENDAERLLAVIDNHWRSSDDEGEIKNCCVHEGIVTEKMNNCEGMLRSQGVYLGAQHGLQTCFVICNLSFHLFRSSQKQFFFVIVDSH